MATRAAPRIPATTVGAFEENCSLVADPATNAAVLIDPGDEGRRLVRVVRDAGVTLLRGNARLSYAELARQVGLSAPAVHERVGKLESSGVVRGYRADVEPEATPDGVAPVVVRPTPTKQGIPEIYADHENSPLRATVEAKSLNELNFDMKRK